MRKQLLFAFLLTTPALLNGCDTNSDSNDKDNFSNNNQAQSELISVTMNKISNEGIGETVGTIRIEMSPYGTLLTPNLAGLKSGLHGFHLHENPSCEPAEKAGEVMAGIAAGGHYASDGSKSHAGPYNKKGHLGDLPALFVNESGEATLPVLAPRIELSDFHGRALMIHEGGDNYSDDPRLGGGGKRVACGIVSGLTSQ